MGRYRVTLSYDGTDYYGWQSQPGGNTVQDEIQSALSTLYRRPLPVVGCGRTDTGVHASDYSLHLDIEDLLFDSVEWIYKVNSLLPSSIAVHTIESVSPDWHARFSAISRCYRYDICFVKPVFDRNFVHWWRSKTYSKELLGQLNSISASLVKYSEWYPFCKSKSDVQSYTVHIDCMQWIYKVDNQRLSFHVSADRFLRGMIRLLVGAHIRVVEGKMTIEDILQAMEEQRLLENPYSAPAKGLSLVGVKY